MLGVCLSMSGAFDFGGTGILPALSESFSPKDPARPGTRLGATSLQGRFPLSSRSERASTLHGEFYRSRCGVAR